MTTTHTPGPWRAMHDGAVQRDAPLPMGGAVVAYTRHADLATQAANARLIAAAPDLLAALHHIEAIAKTGILHQSSLDPAGLLDLLRDAAGAARDAIAAAKGSAAT